MKGIILAGGKGSRLHPLTKATNKHLLPVGKEPMIFHLIRQMKLANIDDILIVTSTEHMGDVVNCLGSGGALDVALTYKVQENPGGIAQALSLTESLIKGDKICVGLADNIFEYSIAPYAKRFLEQKIGARVLLKQVGDPERYGVAALDERQVVDIEEKPSNPKSSYAVVGLYFFDHQVFDIIKTIKPSDRGELEITSVNNVYAERRQLEYDICTGRWTDAGTLQSLFEANKILLRNNNRILHHE